MYANTRECATSRGAGAVGGFGLSVFSASRSMADGAISLGRQVSWASLADPAAKKACTEFLESRRAWWSLTYVYM